MTPADASGSAANRWSDLDRPPLNALALRRGLLRPGGLWSSVEVVPRTGSTNSDLVASAAAGKAAEGAVLVAEEQSAGRGRLDRTWTAPPRSGLFFSVLLTPGPKIPIERWGWLPLLAGVATATALSRAAGVDTALKWPNDLLVTVGGAERKAGGILAERSGDGVVVGIGLNVSLRAEELPVPTAGSLALAGARVVDRDPLLRAVLRSLEEWYTEWRRAGGDPRASRLQEAYAAGCATLGRTVRAELPGGKDLVGEAVAVDGDGRLVLATGDGVQQPVGAGDIVHLRPALSEE
ncbi:biotin--acetyl-CoA-carboxylase ligase [Streptomyces eurocidicus]|uniref:biotin--[biotin carboxyl-carrier protein] ligase n=1 Tax=Streptomyces eurocidicus TaxID=66423 RepID=A0A2N8NP96_STREU|nr:biotin--[acetyl-CoA-carboxylase] ligase [Streptomyces eurocidicus]MBB5117328.1 BirA family biotin operon repressor/biotin-[acetyl-CoA-carboxylase] ligase [Streptomyces eurocidicus]MBF6056203.1 biotin--[acetyl-CoA-carboxylase] ligase [Streptomyces eurocidicus]PNE30588.1 biotin--acetyl-CoA-carboxylase ligase [Streptomyces eurocidicus]